MIGKFCEEESEEKEGKKKDEEGGGTWYLSIFRNWSEKEKKMDELRCLHVLYSQSFLLSS